MFKIYIVRRTDSVGYDEYDECVVVARNEDEAFDIANNNYYIFTREYVEIKEVQLDESKPVMGSYCAG